MDLGPGLLVPLWILALCALLRTIVAVLDLTSVDRKLDLHADDLP